MRLIDAEKLKQIIDKKETWILELIDEEPTAYDVDKVVGELEELRDKAHECFCIGHDTEDMAEYNAFDTAIDIVKAGGNSYVYS